MPHISIIVPVYNVEPYLRRCVGSILVQTITDFELILVDDGSPDNCGKICDEYAARDSRIKVIHQDNQGLSAARNAGLDWVFTNSNSEWITFIDSDDWVHPQYLEFLHSVAQKTGLDIIIGGYALSEGDHPWKEDVLSANPEIWETERFYCEHTVNAIIACAKLYKKNLFLNIRFPLSKLHEDEFTIYKVLFGKDMIAFVNVSLYSYFQNPKGIVHSAFSYKRCSDVLDAIKEQIVFFSKHHFKFAEIMRIKALVESIYKYYWLRKAEEDKVNTLLKREMGIALKKYKSQFPFKENLKYYKICFPFKVFIYKKIVHIGDYLGSLCCVFAKVLDR